MKIKDWIHAARLRTLPLSLSGIIVGSFTAFKQGFWDTSIFVLAVLTTLFFQILSNFANDFGDSYKGTDNENRVGPIRAVQSGKITQKQMLTGVIILTVFSLATAIPLVIIGTKGMPKTILLVYFILAILAILAAITYTIGKKAYGYSGFGDIIVFIFFGLVSVLGSYSLLSKQFDVPLIGFAAGIGFLSVAVLNLNNMRDNQNDKISNKNTLVVKIGFKNAKIYHAALILSSITGILFLIIYNKWWWSFIALLPYFILFKHLKKIIKTNKPEKIDPELKKVSLSTFLIAILFLISTLL